MKKILITLLIAVIAVMSLTACGGDVLTDDDGEQTSEIFDYSNDGMTADDETAGDMYDEELPDGFERTYELSGLEYYNTDTGDWVSTDFIPGAEEYVFHEDLSVEYVYRNYPSYEDMVSDSNYEMVTKTGFYMYVPEENGVSMLIENWPVSGSIEGDKLVIEQDYNGSPAVRAIYTVTDMNEA